MAAGDSTVQDVLDALAEQVGLMPEIAASHSTDITQVQKFPTAIFSWFADTDTYIVTGSDQLWIIPARVNVYMKPIVGNDPRPPIVEYNNLTHKLVDLINRHPHTYPYGSKMASLVGISRVEVVRVRPSEFGLDYAGHRYFGVQLFLEIKMHRRIEY